MLESLHIRNLAVVEELDVEFAPGLNVVTGETGAGKSLIMGALQFLLGERAGPSFIRSGSSQCELNAVLRLPQDYPELAEAVRGILGACGAPPCEDGQLLLRRVLTPGGSRAYVNATPVTLAVLRDLGDALIDIHGPHDHQSLFQPRCQLDLLDSFAGLGGDVGECARLHDRMRLLDEEMTELRSGRSSPDDIELLRHQLVEIESADPEPDEDVVLVRRHELISHSRRVLEIAGQCQQGLTEADGSVTDQLGRFFHLLREIESLDPERGARLAGQLEECVTALQDLSRELGDYAESVDLDAEELARLEDRLDLIQRLKRKYGPALEDVLSTAADVRETLAAAQERGTRASALEQEKRELTGKHAEACRGLSAARMVSGGKLAKAVSAKMRKLAFSRSAFVVRRDDAPPGPRGADRVEFCFAPNPGDDLLPLRKIASSGEMARMMLATKTVLSAADRVPILVFDEVDANIGGRAAVKVADELRAISARHQVLCVTHLPQIAAAAGHHLRVTKRTDGRRTIAEMAPLGASERLDELSRMLGSSTSSEAARNHARELLARGARG